MCKFNTSYRYEALKVLRHPWITRNSNSTIPETLIECYCKMNMIKEFRQLISVGIALHVYKATHQHLFSKSKQCNIVEDPVPKLGLKRKYLFFNP